MALHQFVLQVDRSPSPDEVAALHWRCADVSIEHDPSGGARIAVDREAATLVDAVVSAVRDVDAVGLTSSRVCEDDDLVTLAVIAARIGRSRTTVGMWSLGRTGPGGFPPPLAGTGLYRWSQVARWLGERMGFTLPDPQPVLVAVNLALQLRAIAPRVSRMDVVRSLLAA